MICTNRAILVLILPVIFAKHEPEEVASLRPGPLLLRLNPINQTQVDFLRSFKTDKRGLKLQVWRNADHSGHHVDVWVAQNSFKELLLHIQKLDIQYEVVSDDLYKSIGHRNISLNGIETFDNNYQGFDELVAEMIRLSTFYNDSVKMEKIGSSYGGQAIHAVTIFRNSSTSKPKIVINCGTHAREWLAISSCKYVLRKIIFNQNYDADISFMLKHYDVTMIPILNPDGYIHSRTERYRMWRKSLSKTSDQNCPGVDINRNFGYRWGGGGSSPDVCAEIFCGTHPFSESETLSLARFLYKHRRLLKVYIDVHTYGQLWMSPWGFTSAFSRDYRTQQNALKRIQLAIKSKNGITYKIGQSSDIMYQTSGDSLDWVYGRLGVVHTYGVELRPTLQVKNGFRYSRRAIVLAGEDLLVGLKELSKVTIEEDLNKF